MSQKRVKKAFKKLDIIYGRPLKTFISFLARNFAKSRSHAYFISEMWYDYQTRGWTIMQKFLRRQFTPQTSRKFCLWGKYLSSDSKELVIFGLSRSQVPDKGPHNKYLQLCKLSIFGVRRCSKSFDLRKWQLYIKRLVYFTFVLQGVPWVCVGLPRAICPSSLQFFKSQMY